MFRQQKPEWTDPLPEIAQHVAGETRDVVLVTLLEADAAQSRKALAQHTGAKSYRPVFWVTASDLSAFRARGAVAEHLPPASMVRQFRDLGDWIAYLPAMRDAVYAKWRPRWVARYGLDWSEYLRNCGI